MLIPFSTTFAVSFICLFSCSYYVRAVTCNAEIYGIPNPYDCEDALNEMPFARNSFDRQASLRHFFVEPQYLTRPFDGVANQLRPAPIVQLPKMWKYNSCRIALTSLGMSQRPGVVKPIFVTTWRELVVQSRSLRVCTSPTSSRGGFHILYVSSGIAATLYVYSSDSLFTILMNSYMSHGVPMIPIAPGNEHANDPSTNHSFANAPNLHGPLTLADLNLSMASIKPLQPGEFKLLDSP